MAIQMVVHNFVYKKVRDQSVTDYSNNKALDLYYRRLCCWLKPDDSVPTNIWRECKGVKPTYRANHEA